VFHFLSNVYRDVGSGIAMQESAFGGNIQPRQIIGAKEIIRACVTVALVGQNAPAYGMVDP
jgi:hypothetical protein